MTVGQLFRCHGQATTSAAGALLKLGRAGGCGCDGLQSRRSSRSELLWHVPRRTFITAVMSNVVYSPPVEAFSALYSSLHYSLNLPWPVTIALVGVGVRALCFSLDAVHKRSMRTRTLLKDQVDEFAAEIRRNARRTGPVDPKYVREVRREALDKALKEFKCHPAVDGSATLLNISMFIFGSVGLWKPAYARLHFNDYETERFADMATDTSIPWVTSLADKDPTFILPAIFTVTLAGRLWLMYLEDKSFVAGLPVKRQWEMKRLGRGGVNVVMQTVLVGFSAVVAGVSTQLPCALLIYWVVNGVLQIAKILLLYTRPVQRWFQIPRYQGDDTALRRFFFLSDPTRIVPKDSSK